MAQILALFSDFSAFYLPSPFQDEISVNQPVHIYSVTWISSHGKYGNPQTREEESHWQGQGKHEPSPLGETKIEREVLGAP